MGIGDDYGYTKDNCLNHAKDELLVRETLNCTFNKLSNPQTSKDFDQCSPEQSVRFWRSFRDTNTSSTSKIETVKIAKAIQDRLDKPCPQDCVVDSYSVTATFSPISQSQNLEFEEKFGDNLQNNEVIVLKFFLNSLEYQKIHNFPQHGLQFVAEVGGLMAFFLGISIISLLECFCYMCHCIRYTCCGRCCDDDANEINEELPPPRWKTRPAADEAPPNDAYNDFRDNKRGPQRRPDLSKFDDRRYY